VPTRHVALSSRDKHCLSLVCVGDHHVCVAVNSFKESRSWLCVTDLASCAVVFSAELAGHVTAGRLSEPDGSHVYVGAGESLYVYRLRPDPRFVVHTKIGAAARIIIFAKVHGLSEFFHAWSFLTVISRCFFHYFFILVVKVYLFYLLWTSE